MSLLELPAGSFIASGPVIIENGRVLLNREKKPDGSLSPWMFPGGKVEDFDQSLEDACRREVKEEMGLEIEILRPLKPIMYHQDRVIILIHYLAKRLNEIAPGDEIGAWDWHDIHNLPADCAPNIYEIIKDYLQSV